jgi:hypothetical protein
MKNISTSQVNNNQINQDSGPNPHRWKALGILSLAQLLKNTRHFKWFTFLYLEKTRKFKKHNG